MQISCGKPQAGSDRTRRRMVYSESPLVASGNIQTSSVGGDCTSSCVKSDRRQTCHGRGRDSRTIPAVTPSPQREHTTIGSRQQLSSNNQRRLFRSQHGTMASAKLSKASSGRKNPHKARKRLFKSDVVLGSNDKDSSNIPCEALEATTRTTSTRKSKSQSFHGVVRHHRLQLMSSWDSLASVVIGAKSGSTEEKLLTKPDGATRPSNLLSKPNAEEPPNLPPKDNSGKKIIPLDLVAVLAPIGLKAVNRLPQTHEEVLKKAEAQRKKHVPPRTPLPRRCKSNHSTLSYNEDSDDDLFFDSIMYGDRSGKVASEVTVPAQVTTRDDASASPLTTSIPDAGPPVQMKEVVPYDVDKLNHNKAIKQHGSRWPRRSTRPTRSTARPADDAPEWPLAVDNVGIAEKDGNLEQKRRRGRPRKVVPGPTIEALPSLAEPSRLVEMPRETAPTLRNPCPEASLKASARIQKKSGLSIDETPARDSDATRLGHRETMQGETGTSNVVASSRRRAKPEVDEQKGGQVFHERSIRPIVKIKTAAKPTSSSKCKTSKVRFAPTTTTFSLKIRLKTSACSSKRGRKRRVAPPALSESAMQNIAKQITQAYLAQNPGSITGTGQFNDEDEGNGTDGDDEEISDSESSTSSSSENESEDDAEQGKKHRQVTRSVEPLRGQEGATNMGTRKQREVLIDQDQDHDARSVASEITMDIDLLRGEYEVNAARAGPTKEVDESPSFPLQDDESFDEPQALTLSHDNDKNANPVPDVDLRQHEAPYERGCKRRRISSVAPELGTSFAFKSSPSRRDKQVRHSKDSSWAEDPKFSMDSRAESTAALRRKRRRLSSTDSLMGSSGVFVPSVRPTTQVVPTEVSVGLHQEGFQSKHVMEARNGEEGGLAMDRVAESCRRQQGRGSAGDHRSDDVGGNEETVVTDKSHESKHPPELLVPGKCGKCSGCLQAFDCLTCSKCISSLQCGIRIGQRTGCLRRICKVMSIHQKSMDTLGRECNVDETVGQDRPNPPTGTCEREVDDDSMSHYSQTGSVYSTASKQRRSRAARMWNRRWSKERQRMSSNASTSSDIKWNLSGRQERLASTKNGHADGSRKRGKKTKSVLHDLELPMATDGSVASVVESRKALRALMTYDEADQDWL